MSEYLERRGFNEGDISRWHLRDNVESEVIYISYYDKNGQILYERQRYYGQDTSIPKYKSPLSEQMPEKHSWLYGLWNLDSGNSTLIINEGEFNTIALNKIGFNALGIAGQVIKLKWDLLKVLPENINKITLLYDKIEYALKRAAEIEENFGDKIQIYIALYPDDKDANDYLISGNITDLKQIIISAKPYHLGYVIEEISINEVERVIKRFFPEYWLDALCCINVVTSMVFKDFTSPIALFLVGPPSSGKTTVLDMFLAKIDEMGNYIYRSDNFTPRAWLSHIASVKKEKLKEIHLLPRIEDRTMVTKDLSCLLSKDYEDLEEDIGVVTVVLDGRGLSTDSGSKGKIEYRGKNGHVFFCWLGATTPLTKKSWEVIGVKGNRFLFLNIKDRNIEDSAVIENVFGEISYNEKVELCSEIVGKYIRYFYWKHGLYKVEWDKARDKNSIIIRYIVKLAKLVSVLRAPINYFISSDGSREGRTQFTQNLIEMPYRLTEQLSTIARSNALNHGRNELTADDLKIIRYIALSSVPLDRKLSIEALVNSEKNENGRPVLKTSDLVQKLNISSYKAKSIIKLFGLLKICEVRVPNQRIGGSGVAYISDEYSMVLNEDYMWLIDDIFNDSWKIPA